MINHHCPPAATPTSPSSEQKIAKVPNSEPWKTQSEAMYQYYPGGNPNAPKKDAPSALNEVIIPNVNLPKVMPNPDRIHFGKSC